MDLRALGYESPEPMVWRCLREWATLAEDVLASLESLGGRWEMWVEKFGLHRVRKDLEIYRSWVQAEPGRGKGVVFARKSDVKI